MSNVCDLAGHILKNFRTGCFTSSEKDFSNSLHGSNGKGVWIDHDVGVGSSRCAGFACAVAQMKVAVIWVEFVCGSIPTH